MAGEVLWKCPEHGYVPAQEIDGQGIFCLADDPVRSHGICGRPCKGPAKIAATGKLLRPQSERDWNGRMNKEGMPMTYAPRKPGTASCEECGKDMAGEHSRSKRCTECRPKKKRPTGAPRRRVSRRKTGSKTKTTTSAPAQPARPVAASRAESGERSLLDRISDLEDLVGGHLVPADLAKRVEQLERELAELRRGVFGEKITA